MRTADIIICGAGIAGIAAAYQLSVKHRAGRIVLVDERPPLTLTSDKSTECYRNWWPGPGDAMVGLMNRSIDILEELAAESGNTFNMNRRGYLYATADQNRIAVFERAALESESLGAGTARMHREGTNEGSYATSPAQGYLGQPTGSDLLLEPSLVRAHYPYLSDQTVAAVHARRCGWFSAQQLGMHMLERARASGVELVRDRITGIDIHQARIQGVRTAGGEQIQTGKLVIAAGPFLKQMAAQLDVAVPVFCERHVKVTFDDYLGVVPRDAPLLIWTDPVRLAWSDEEREAFAASPKMRWLTEEMPAGVHGRPEGGPESHTLLMLWTYDMSPVEPSWPLPIEPHYQEIVLRGMTAMIPGLEAYIGKSPKAFIDGGYYTKTRENRPLIGPLPIEGAYVIGAFSGFGLMASCGAADLLAAHMTGGPLPTYAPAFLLERYTDPAYQRLLATWGESGQL
jgi:glycine/D-amino acid oxidase-like deaminating enzyme